MIGSQPLRFNLSLRMNSSFITSRPDLCVLSTFTTAGEWDCVAVVKRLFALHYSVDYICNVIPLGSRIPLWYFETIKGSLMRSNWPKLASLAQTTCTFYYTFSCVMYYLLPTPPPPIPLDGDSATLMAI